jgi:hypothetical protein
MGGKGVFRRGRPGSAGKGEVVELVVVVCDIVADLVVAKDDIGNGFAALLVVAEDDADDGIVDKRFVG